MTISAAYIGANAAEVYIGTTKVFPVASSSPEHSVFTTAAPPYTLTAYTDGTPRIRLGSTFYTYGSGKGAWRLKGGRIYLPAGVAVGKPLTMYAYKIVGVGDAQYSRDAVVGTGTIASTVAGWNSVRWAPVAMVPGGSGGFYQIAYEFTGSGTGVYVHAPGPSNTFIPAADGVQLALAEPQRSSFSIGGATNQQGDPWYGTDIIVDEGA